nr:MAG TPA: hypothetical protein [Caudoviricetes sp.]
MGSTGLTRNNQTERSSRAYSPAWREPPPRN